ncbi:hypothetical protein D9M68_943890 [compost metagenome]
MHIAAEIKSHWRKAALPRTGNDARSARAIGANKAAPIVRTTVRMMSNVGVDRHAAALRRKAYAPAHGLRRKAAACPRRTTC